MVSFLAPGLLISVSLFVFLVGATKDTDSLKSVTVPLIGQQQCRQMYQDADRDLSDSMLCAGYAHGGADSCKADSGGPLTCKTEGNHTIISCMTLFSFKYHLIICTTLFWFKCCSSRMIRTYSLILTQT